MATFTGTAADETITPTFVTAGVLVLPAGVKPSNADDIINAGAGVDTIDSGGGNDTVTGQQGDDIVQLGAGTDRFIWNPGDGNDTVDGGAGNDTLDFFGSGSPENINLSANGSYLKFFRNVANVSMDVDNIERVVFHALGGPDSITVGNLSATDVKQVAINLEGTLGSGTGDAQADTVIFNATDAGNAINIVGAGGSITIGGLPWHVTISAFEAMDSLVVNASSGNDTISAAGVGNPLGALTIDAGSGNDTVIGRTIADVLLGGSGNDTVTGRRGDDVLLLGTGSDRAI